MKNIFVLPFFVLVYIAIVSLISYDKSNRIDEALKEKLSYLETTYKQAFDRFDIIAENVYNSFQNDEKFLDILSRAQDEPIEKIHDEAYAYLKDEFEKIKHLEVLGIQIVTPQNISVLRMHDPHKYGDDLSKVRYSIAFVNKHRMSIKGFEEGKASHFFRMDYPLFKEGKYIGVLEVDFSSTMLQTYSMRVSEIHTHFIVDRNVFATNEWKSRVLEPYEQSIEHKDFMFSLSDHINHSRLEESRITLIEPLREQIDEKIQTQKEFALYRKIGDNVRVVAFLPIQRIKDDKRVAYLVSYTNSNKILIVLQQYQVILLVLTLGFIFGYIVVSKLLKQKLKMENELQYDALTTLYNRKHFLSFLHQECENARVLEGEICVVMADIDFFKDVNDTYGHQCGDKVLQEFSSILKTSLRSIDKVARYGGEEFIILLIANEVNAYKIVENMRKKIEEFSFCDGEKLKITASFGLSQFQYEDLMVESVIQRADRALYKSKESGRNQVQIL